MRHTFKRIGERMGKRRGRKKKGREEANPGYVI